MNKSKLIPWLSASFCVAAICGCAATADQTSVVPQVQQGQELVNTGGAVGLISNGEAATVKAVIAESGSETFPFVVFELEITNLTPGAVEFLASTITVREEGETNYWILSPEEHVTALKELYARDGFANSAADATAGGSFIHSNSYAGASHYSNDGATTYAASSGRNQSMEARVARASEGYLDDSVLPAGKGTEGALWAVLPEASANSRNLLLTVPVGGEFHRFRFALSQPNG